MTSNWTAEDIPDQHGRTAIVTGANSGLGRIVARELAGHGAAVIMASRDDVKGAEAARESRLRFRHRPSRLPSSILPTSVRYERSRTAFGLATTTSTC
jgi:NAD(P)-dependent dehydrogenase (short-subunit alcohol dehydrogenase family)